MEPQKNDDLPYFFKTNASSSRPLTPMTSKEIWSVLLMLPTGISFFLSLIILATATKLDILGSVMTQGILPLSLAFFVPGTVIGKHPRLLGIGIICSLLLMLYAQILPVVKL